MPCKILSFEEHQKTSKIICQTPSGKMIHSQEYVGNRGINLIEDYVYTPHSMLNLAVPSQSAKNFKIEKTSYKSNLYGNLTIWLKGYFVPEKSSKYEFEIINNGKCVLFISKSSSSANKVCTLDH